MYSEDEDFEEDDEPKASASSGFNFRDFYESNKKIVIILAVLLGLVIILSLAKGCNNSGGSTSAQVELILDKESLSVNVGGSAKIIPSVNKNNNAQFVYTIQDTNIATVDSVGNVTGVALGNTILTVTYDDNGNVLSKTCNISVISGREGVMLTNIDFSDNMLIIGKGQEFQINPVSTPTDGYITSLSYSSSNSTVAKITDSGLLTANELGTCEITIRANNSITNKLKVKVLAESEPLYVKAVETFKLKETSKTIIVGESYNIEYEMEPSDAYFDSLEWVSTDTSIATVEKGVVTGVKEGQSIVNVLKEGYRVASTIIIVKAEEVKATSLTITSGENITVSQGSIANIIVNVEPPEATNKTCTYTSGNTGVATVSESGVVTGISAGTATITVTCGELVKTVNVTVTSSGGGTDPGYDPGTDPGYDPGPSGGTDPGTSNTCTDLVTVTTNSKDYTSTGAGALASNTTSGNSNVVTSNSTVRLKVTLSSNNCGTSGLKYCYNPSGSTCTPSKPATVGNNFYIDLGNTSGATKTMVLIFQDSSGNKKTYSLKYKIGADSSGNACWCDYNYPTTKKCQWGTKPGNTYMKTQFSQSACPTKRYCDTNNSCPSACWCDSNYPTSKSCQWGSQPGSSYIKTTFTQSVCSTKKYCDSNNTCYYCWCNTGRGSQSCTWSKTSPGGLYQKATSITSESVCKTKTTCSALGIGCN